MQSQICINKFNHKMKYGSSKQYGITCSKLIMVLQSSVRACTALLFFI